jgi:uncharacterized membrane protein YgcG
MIAYNKTYLQNERIQEQAAMAHAHELISNNEQDEIRLKYPVAFYTPNFFIRIGLFLLTLVIASFSFGFFGLIFMSAIENIIEGMTILFALLVYAALEYMVKKKNHYKSGVDDALLWLSAAMLFGGISFLTNAGEIGNCLLAFIISLYATLRFADRLMAIVAYLALLGVIFFTADQLGGMVKAILPFILMAASAAVYFGIIYLKKRPGLENYHDCFSIIRIAALLSFYAAGNFYVVKELSSQLYHLPAGDRTPIPFGWLFWIFTFIIPVGYIARGIQMKDAIFLRTGMLLIAALVFTVRYYYAITPPEVAMTVGGILLLIISYGLIQYLKQPKFGFTNAANDVEDNDGKLQIESLVIAETFGQQTAADDSTKFGGGSFGGGGASGDFE